MPLSLYDSYQTEAGAWAGAAGLGAGGLGLLDQAVTRVAGGEKAIAAGQDCLVFLEVCHKFRTERMQRQTQEKRINNSE